MQPKSILKTSIASREAQSAGTAAGTRVPTSSPHVVTADAESQPLLSAADAERPYLTDGDQLDDGEQDTLPSSSADRAAAQRRFWRTLLYALLILSLLIVILVLGGRELGVGKHRPGGDDLGRRPPVGPVPPQ